MLKPLNLSRLKKKILFYLICTFGVLLSSLVVSELVVRISIPFIKPYIGIDAKPTIGSGIYRLSEDLGYDMIPDVKKGGVNINSLGMRGSETNYNTHRFKIFCIGDSVTFGDYASNDGNTYPSMLESELAKYGFTTMCFNGGRQGYRLWQVSKYYDLIKKYQPDLVLVCAGWNDIGISMAIGSSPESHMLSRRLCWQRGSYLVKLLRRLYGNPVIDEEQVLHFRSEMTSLVRKCKKDGIKVALIRMPTILSATYMRDADYIKLGPFKKSAGALLKVYQRYSQEIENTAQAEKIPLLSSGLEYGVNDKSNMIVDHCHPNDQGYQYMAEIVSRELIRYKLQQNNRTN